MSKVSCPNCRGGRLNREALSYKLDKYGIQDLVQMDIQELRDTLYNIKLSERQQEIGHQILKEIRDRLDFLLNVGLNYLSLNREAQTLSGGEAQRIRLATQMEHSLLEFSTYSMNQVLDFIKGTIKSLFNPLRLFEI